MNPTAFDGQVYCTGRGSRKTHHSDIECQYILQAARIRRKTEYNALLSGSTRCRTCTWPAESQ